MGGNDAPCNWLQYYTKVLTKLWRFLFWQSGMADGNLHTNHMVACLATSSIRLSDRELPYTQFWAQMAANLQSAHESFAPNWVVGGPGIIFIALFLRKLQSKQCSCNYRKKHGMEPTWHVLASNFLSFHWITDIVPDSWPGDDFATP